MRALISLVLVLLIVFGIYYFYFKRAGLGGSQGGSPVQAITVTGVQNDLLAIAQAERIHFAEHGSYASMAELTSSGALAFSRPGRDGYTYAVEVTPEGFSVTARYTGPDGASYPTLVVDQTMHVQRAD